MKKRYHWFIILLMACLTLQLNANGNKLLQFRDDVIQDYVHYYSPDTLVHMLAAFGVGSVLANTNLDQKIQNLYQDDLSNYHANSWANVRLLGTRKFAWTYVAAGALWLLPLPAANNVVGDWGQRCIRAIIVGLPPVGAMQWVTGSARPMDDLSSHWQPFVDQHGVSGHSFFGAVPFITAAKMTDNQLLKLVFYAGSTATGLSRVNDDKHYFSQIFLGWIMAYYAVDSVNKTSRSRLNIVPVPMNNGAGLSVSYVLD